jgi:hypothetical protein
MAAADPGVSGLGFAAARHGTREGEPESIADIPKGFARQIIIGDVVHVRSTSRNAVANDPRRTDRHLHPLRRLPMRNHMTNHMTNRLASSRGIALASSLAGCVACLSIAAVASAVPSAATEAAPQDHESQSFRFRFEGGTAEQYFRKVEEILKAWSAKVATAAEDDFAEPNIVLMQGLDLVPVPAMTIDARVQHFVDLEVIGGSLIGLFNGIELAAWGDAIAMLETAQVDGSIVVVAPRFFRAEKTSGALVPISLAQWSMLAASDPSSTPAAERTVSVFPIGTADGNTVLDAVAAAIELAGLGEETELMLHAPSGMLIVRTTAAGREVTEQLVAAIMAQQRMRGSSEATGANAARLATEAALQRLQDEAVELRTVLAHRENTILELKGEMAMLRTQLQMLTEESKPKPATP